MEFLTTNSEAILSLLISGILGVAGQVVRVCIGLRKLYSKRVSLTHYKEETLSTCKLGSIFMGFGVGVALTLLTGTLFHGFSAERVLALIAWGYTVTDIVENKIALKAKQTNKEASFPREDHQPNEFESHNSGENSIVF